MVTWIGTKLGVDFTCFFLSVPRVKLRQPMDGESNNDGMSEPYDRRVFV